jgi:hypothetical protein
MALNKFVKLILHLSIGLFMCFIAPIPIILLRKESQPNIINLIYNNNTSYRILSTFLKILEVIVCVLSHLIFVIIPIMRLFPRLNFSNKFDLVKVLITMLYCRVIIIELRYSCKFVDFIYK